jgi:hypothetical protein
MKKKRKLPPHIVLPNGQWRFVKRGSKSARTTRIRSVKTMARRRYGRKRSRGFSMGGIGSAFSFNNILKATVFGAIGAYAAPMLGQNQQTGAIIGGALGGGSGLIGKAIGAGIGAVAGVPVANAASGMIGNITGGNTGGAW